MELSKFNTSGRRATTHPPNEGSSALGFQGPKLVPGLFDRVNMTFRQNPPNPTHPALSCFRNCHYLFLIQVTSKGETYSKSGQILEAGHGQGHLPGQRTVSSIPAGRGQRGGGGGGEADPASKTYRIPTTQHSRKASSVRS